MPTDNRRRRSPSPSPSESGEEDEPSEDETDRAIAKRPIKSKCKEADDSSDSNASNGDDDNDDDDDGDDGDDNDDNDDDADDGDDDVSGKEEMRVGEPSDIVIKKEKPDKNVLGVDMKIGLDSSEIEETASAAGVVANELNLKVSTDYGGAVSPPPEVPKDLSEIETPQQRRQRNSSPKIKTEHSRTSNRTRNDFSETRRQPSDDIKRGRNRATVGVRQEAQRHGRSRSRSNSVKRHDRKDVASSNRSQLSNEFSQKNHGYDDRSSKMPDSKTKMIEKSHGSVQKGSAEGPLKRSRKNQRRSRSRSRSQHRSGDSRSADAKKRSRPGEAEAEIIVRRHETGINNHNSGAEKNIRNSDQRRNSPSPKSRSPLRKRGDRSSPKRSDDGRSNRLRKEYDHTSKPSLRDRSKERHTRPSGRDNDKLDPGFDLLNKSNQKNDQQATRVADDLSNFTMVHTGSQRRRLPPVHKRPEFAKFDSINCDTLAVERGRILNDEKDNYSSRFDRAKLAGGKGDLRERLNARRGDAMLGKGGSAGGFRSNARSRSREKKATFRQNFTVNREEFEFVQRQMSGRKSPSRKTRPLYKYWSEKSSAEESHDDEKRNQKNEFGKFTVRRQKSAERSFNFTTEKMDQSVHGRLGVSYQSFRPPPVWKGTERSATGRDAGSRFRRRAESPRAEERDPNNVIRLFDPTFTPKGRSYFEHDERNSSYDDSQGGAGARYQDHVSMAYGMRGGYSGGRYPPPPGRWGDDRATRGGGGSRGRDYWSSDDYFRDVRPYDSSRGRRQGLGGAGEVWSHDKFEEINEDSENEKSKDGDDLQGGRGKKAPPVAMETGSDLTASGKGLANSVVG